MRIDADFTDYLKIPRSAYSNYENGIRNIPIEVFARLADYYETSVDYLAGRDNMRNRAYE